MAGEIGMWQAENATIDSLRKQLLEYQVQQTQLEIRAPASGRVIARRLADELGKHVAAGTTLLAIGDDSRKEAIALLSQQDAKYIASISGSHADLRIWGQEKLLPASVDQIKPRSRDDLPHFAFAGIYDGPLDVLERKQVENSDTYDENDQLMLVHPRIPAKLALRPETSRQLRAGEVGLAHIRGRNQKLGGYLLDRTTRWLKMQITETHGL